MDFKFSIHFTKSASTEYKTAVEYASLFEKFTPPKPGSHINIVETNNQEVLAKYDVFQKLIGTIGDWESAVILFQDQEFDVLSFLNNIAAIADCALCCMKSENESQYCTANSNCWGCRQLNGIVLHHSEHPYNDHTKYWYQYGAFKTKTSWAINKEEITQALSAIVEKKRIDFCPVFQNVFFRKIVAALPSDIDTTDTKNWGKLYLDESLSIEKQWDAINIYHKILHSLQTKAGITVKKDADAANSKANEHNIKLSQNENLRYIPETSFKDIAGIDTIIQNIRTVIELPIKKPELYDYMGVKPYRGILLWGEPGNGKTLIAKAIAHEVKGHFIGMGGPDILNKNFGESEKKLRDIFNEARQLQPSIIFIDEIDSIAQTRMAGESSKWYGTVVNQLMSLMDGINEFGNVTIIASTNRPDLLDPALLRPGRFDYKVEVKKPNLPACKKVLEIATRGMPLAKDIDLFTFAESVVGFSAAEITFIAKEAAMSAIRRTIDIKSIINDDYTSSDFSHIEIISPDFFNALLILKANAKYGNKMYSLKG